MDSPIAADCLNAALFNGRTSGFRADHAGSSPVPGQKPARNIAGPDVFALDELSRITSPPVVTIAR
jgi:hypothetical protein